MPITSARLRVRTRSNFLVDPGQEPPDMTVRGSMHRTGDNITRFVKH